MEATKRVTLHGVTYELGLVGMAEYDKVWSAATRLLSLAIKSANGIDMTKVAKTGKVDLSSLSFASIGSAFEEAKDLLGWQFLYRELGPILAKSCGVIDRDTGVPRRLEAIYDEHWDKHRGLAFSQWVVEALKHNCADFLSGFGALMSGSETPTPSASTSPNGSAQRTG